MPSEPHLGAVGQLAEVMITDVTFHRDWGFDFDEDGPPVYNVESSSEATVAEGHEHGSVRLNATIVWERGGEHADGPFELQLTLLAIFEWAAPEVSEDSIRGWLEFNSEHLLWPYLRAEVARITLAAGLPPLTIYTVAVPRPHLGRESAPSLDEGAEAP